MAIDLATDPVVRTFLKELVQLGGNALLEVVDFILKKTALPVPITMAFELFTSMKVHLRNAPVPERERRSPRRLLHCVNLDIVGNENCGGAKERRNAVGSLECGFRGRRPTARTNFG